MGQPVKENIYEAAPKIEQKKEKVTAAVVSESNLKSDSDSDESELFQFIRDKRRKPYGVMGSKLLDTKFYPISSPIILITVSLCNPKDRWNKQIGKHIVSERLKKFIPEDHGVRCYQNDNNTTTVVYTALSSSQYSDIEDDIVRFGNRSGRYFIKKM